MPTNLSIYKAAITLIERHGKEAFVMIAKKVHETRDCSDQKDHALWLRVLNAIKELQKDRLH